MCPHCTSQPSSFSFIAKQTIASILRLLYTSQNYMMPFQTILYYYHLLYNILFFNIIGSSPFPPYCSKDQRVDQTRQAAVSLFLLLCTRTYIYIWLYSDYSSNSCTILALSPYYSPDQKGKRPFLLLCIHLFSSKMGTGRTHTHHNHITEQGITNISQTNGQLLIKKQIVWIVVDEKANSLDLFTKSLPQWLLKCQTSLSPANK